MKLASHVATSEMVGIDRTRKFNIRASAKAFKIMSSQIYSNKIRAVIRELSCNAFDAHVARDNFIRDYGPQDYLADPGTKFLVDLPNSVSPTFQIRDFGIGLSNDDLETLYSTYFESTKAESNDFVGALGLGSKSPFSYATSFTVTSFYRGTKSVYFVYMDDSGEPHLSLVSTEDVDVSLPENKNGLMISVAVNASDFYSFEVEGMHVFSTFPDCIIVNGDTHIPNCQFFSRFSHRTHNIYHDKLQSSGNSYVVQGHVRYPVSVEHLSLSADEDYIEKLLRRGIVIDAPIGSVDFAASREELSYIPSTIAYIKDAVTLLYNDIISELTVAANSFECPWKLEDWYSSLNQFQRDLILPVVVAQQSKFPNIKIDVNSYYRRVISLGSVAVDKQELDDAGIQLYRLTHRSRNHTLESYWTVSQSAHSSRQGSTVMTFSDNPVIIVSDSKASLKSICNGVRANLNLGYRSTVYIATKVDPTSQVDVSAKLQELASNRYSLSRMTLHKSSSVAVKLDKASDIPLSQIKVSKYSDNDRTFIQSSSFSPVPGMKYYYVILEMYQPVSDERYDMDSEVFCRYVTNIVKSTPDSVFIGVHKTHLPALKKQPNCYPVNDLIEQYVRSFDTSRISSAYRYYDIKSDKLSIITSIANSGPEYNIPEREECKAALDWVSKHSDGHGELSVVNAVVALNSKTLKLPSLTGIDRTSTLLFDISVRYPLVGLLSKHVTFESTLNDVASDILFYMNSVNSKSQPEGKLHE